MSKGKYRRKFPLRVEFCLFFFIGLKVRNLIHETKLVTMDIRDYQIIQRQSITFNREVDLVNSTKMLKCVISV